MVEFHKALIPSDSVGWCKFLRKRVDATPESLFWRPRAPKVKNLLRECPPKSTCGRQKAFAVSRRADICQTSALLFLARRGQRRRFRLPRRSLLSSAHTHTLAALFFQRVRDATTDPRPQLHQQLFSATFIFVCCYKQR